MNTLLKTAAAASGALVIAGTAHAANWDMPTPYSAREFHTKNVEMFAKDVAAATKGKLTIKVHPGASLIKHPEIPKAIRGGQVQIGEFLLSILANDNPVFGVDSVPGLATNYADARKLWNASRSYVEKLLAKQNMVVLYAVPWPPQGIYAKKELKSVADLKGLKFRTYNAATSRFANLAGAVPTLVQVPELPQAFQTGRVQAMVTSAATGVNIKAWDFVSHYHDTQAWLPKNIIVVNRRALRGLDRATRNALIAAGKKAEARGWKMSEEVTAATTTNLTKGGITVVKPSAELAADIKKIGETMAAEWAKAAGKDGAAILKAYRK